uniref:NADH dehydrogenase subunit 4L n=1 Tax=Cantonius szechuanensis TaxID=3045900 RepID=UPI00257C538E|nr:NADH dehydrogenase subunit 4L [Cantonius szechuanensis]WHE42530.1 NADH dehydrogenase subunit 4L [Cantonius szechuanensis]
MLLLNYLSMYMLFIGLVVLFSKRKHFLLMLLSLEFIIISIYLFLMVIFGFYNYEYFFSMIFLTMMVCESALGLSILVSMIRTHGSDYLLSFSMLW